MGPWHSAGRWRLNDVDEAAIVSAFDDGMCVARQSMVEPITELLTGIDGAWHFETDHLTVRAAHRQGETTTNVAFDMDEYGEIAIRCGVYEDTFFGQHPEKIFLAITFLPCVALAVIAEVIDSPWPVVGVPFFVVGGMALGVYSPVKPPRKRGAQTKQLARSIVAALERSDQFSAALDDDHGIGR